MPGGPRRTGSRRPATSPPARRGVAPSRVTVGDVGEFELIDLLNRALGNLSPPPPAGPGDDAAVVRTGARTIVTTDTLEENVHFRRTWSTPEQVGFRALEVNLSDVAAMGGIPGTAVVSLVLPARLRLAAALGLYRGLARSARRSSVSIAGGNISRASSNRVSITLAVLGRPAASRPVLRSGGRPGDLIVVSGFPGLAGLGRRIMETGGMSKDLWNAAVPAQRKGNQRGAVATRSRSGARPEPVAAAALRRFLTPDARVELGVRLARSGATAMIDVSDGLAADLAHLTVASGAGAEIDRARLPRFRGLLSFCEARGWSAEELVLSGGEDYELLFTMARQRWERLRAGKATVPLTVIGRLTSKKEDLVLFEGRERWKLSAPGYRHF